MEEKVKEVAQVHDFAAKLLQPSVFPRLKEYILWQRAIRDGKEKAFYDSPDKAPISINLDLTTGCNYACDHCVDLEILNQPDKFDHEKLRSSLDRMWKKGLKSVILIGGGEPTLYSRFEDIVSFLKERSLDIAVVSNGTGMRKIKNVGNLFGERDWVRLSLDSGTDETFQAMHKPKKPIKLEEICVNVLDTKKVHPNLNIGFSYIVTWKGAYANNAPIVENIDEIVLAAKLARDHKFNYLSIKPFLERSPENSAEMLGIHQPMDEYQETIKRIAEKIEEAKKFETPDFKIRESTNLRALETGLVRDYTRQPRNCHMSFFHGVLSPLGAFICPVYRSVEKARIGDKDAYATEDSANMARRKTAEVIRDFNAAHECRNVTCLYNSANWLVEKLIENPKALEELNLSKESADYFF